MEAGHLFEFRRGHAALMVGAVHVFIEGKMPFNDPGATGDGRHWCGKTDRVIAETSRFIDKINFFKMQVN